MSITIDFDRLSTVFLAEAEEHLQMMEEAILSLESRPDDPELIQTIFRRAHTLKGGAGVLGFTVVAEFTHTLEDLLDWMRGGQLRADKAMANLLLQSVDVTRQLLTAAASGKHALSAGQKKVMERLTKKSRAAAGKVPQAVTPADAPVAAAEGAASAETRTEGSAEPTDDEAAEGLRGAAPSDAGNDVEADDGIVVLEAMETAGLSPRDHLTAVFLAEVEENLQEMEEAVISLESRPADGELIQTIFRIAHTLKGAAGVLGYAGVIEFTHTLEDLLDRMRNSNLRVNRGLVNLLLQSVDVVRQLSTAAASGEHALNARQMKVMERLSIRGRTAATATEGPQATVATDASVAAGSDPAAAPEIPMERTAGEAGDRPASDSGSDTDAVEVSDALEILESANMSTSVHPTTLRVGIEKLDELLNLVGQILIDRGHTRTMLESTHAFSRAERIETHRQADHLYVDLQELSMQMRMVPLGPTFRQHLRTVRDLTEAQQKQARLVIEGADVEVDTAVIEHLRDPLTHMIRNAVDHGIEPPDVRQAGGKNPTGRLTLRAFHEAGSVIVQLEDDGAGLARSRIIERARTMPDVADPDNMSDRDLQQLVFEPGFSTAETVTEVSGRGVGMDVVRKNIEALRGSIGLRSSEGKGTTITIRLPLTLAIIDGFLVDVTGQTYVIPMESVVECAELPEAAQENGAGGGVIRLRGEPVPYIRLRELFQLNDGELPPREHIVIVQDGDRWAALAVDQLLGQGQVVIKPLEGLTSAPMGIAGSTILGDGRVALIVDVPALLREAVIAGAV